MLEFRSPFTFLFRDKDWLKKFALASLLTYTLVGAAPVMGWMVEVARRVAKGNAAPLPAWDNWKTFWREGARLVGVNVLWLLPVALAVIVIYLPLIFVEQMSGETLLVVWGLTLLCVLAFLFIYSILYVFFIPAMTVRIAANDTTWKSAWVISLWKTVRPFFTEYLLVFLVVGMALFNAAFVLASLTFFLFLPPLLVYVGLVTTHFAGQLLRLEQ